MDGKITFEKLEAKYILPLAEAFANYGGDKNEDKFRQHLESQNLEIISCLVVLVDSLIVGYVTIIWESSLKEFAPQKIPEISDLNILPEYRGKKIASKLLDEVENIIGERSAIAGIGVGLTKDYAAAQRLYVKRGYLPLGIGLTYKYHPVSHGEQVRVDDDLVFWFTKKLNY